jgi:hypothetical protein
MSAPEPYGLRLLRRAATNDYSANLLSSEAADVVAEIERLRADVATIADLRAKLSSVTGYGAVEVEVEVEHLRAALAAANAEAATMREWAARAAADENENARDLEAALARAVEAERERDEWRASLAGQRRRADSLAQSWLHEQGENDKTRIEISALRNQVESARALGVSLHKAADTGAKAERAAVVAWLEKAGWMPSMVEVFRRGEHRREETK